MLTPIHTTIIHTLYIIHLCEWEHPHIHINHSFPRIPFISLLLNITLFKDQKQLTHRWLKLCHIKLELNVSDILFLSRKSNGVGKGHQCTVSAQPGQHHSPETHSCVFRLITVLRYVWVLMLIIPQVFQGRCCNRRILTY